MYFNFVAKYFAALCLSPQRLAGLHPILCLSSTLRFELRTTADLLNTSGFFVSSIQKTLRHFANPAGRVEN